MYLKRTNLYLLICSKSRVGEQTFGEAGGGGRDYLRRCGTTLWRTLSNTNTNKQTNTGKQTQNMQKGKAQLQVTEVIWWPNTTKRLKMETQRQRGRSKHKFIKKWVCETNTNLYLSRRLPWLNKYEDAVDWYYLKIPRMFGLNSVMQ